MSDTYGHDEAMADLDYLSALERNDNVDDEVTHRVSDYIATLEATPAAAPAVCGAMLAAAFLHDMALLAARNTTDGTVQRLRDGFDAITAALTDRTAAIAAAREAGREEQRALDAEAHGEVVARLERVEAQAQEFADMAFDDEGIELALIFWRTIIPIWQGAFRRALATQPTTSEEGHRD